MYGLLWVGTRSSDEPRGLLRDGAGSADQPMGMPFVPSRQLPCRRPGIARSAARRPEPWSPAVPHDKKNQGALFPMFSFDGWRKEERSRRGDGARRGFARPAVVGSGVPDGVQVRMRDVLRFLRDSKCLLPERKPRVDLFVDKGSSRFRSDREWVSHRFRSADSRVGASWSC
ncbi:hypothetical protein SCOR_12005 [Sulfidibacter corallicola]